MKRVGAKPVTPRRVAMSRRRPVKLRGRSRFPALRVAVVTGTRAEYGLLRSSMEAIRDHRRLQLQLVVTGSHLLPKFGRTIDDIIRDGWHIDARVKMQAGNDGPLDQAEGLARGVTGIARFLEEADTDIVLVLGDRIEAMAGALAGVTTGRIVAHVHGGDVASGDFDENLRHAITKLAHVHFTATESARRRVLQMGEEPARVHVVGAPGLDRIRQLRNGRMKKPAPSGRALVLHHPCGRSAERERRSMQTILRAVTGSGLKPAIIYPNTDRGHRGIVQAIERCRTASANGTVKVYRSLDRDAFLRLLLEADVLVGNSSCGLIEAPAAGTPSVNVGPRQRGRERFGPTVLDADETAESIRRALAKARRARPITSSRNLPGDRSAGRRIAELLAQVRPDGGLRRKGFVCWKDAGPTT